MRNHGVLASLAGLALLAATTSAPAQIGYDRHGGDYANFSEQSGDPANCATRCEHDPRCRAWSFSYPTGSGVGAICWLKNAVVPRAPNPCCMSGVKGAGVIEPRPGPVEFSIDRLGGDYRVFETPPDPTGKACIAACESETRCRAWTYRRPGYGGPVARCFLKERLTPPNYRPCCVSGVVR
jgi:hypothetical protein